MASTSAGQQKTAHPTIAHRLPQLPYLPDMKSTTSMKMMLPRAFLCFICYFVHFVPFSSPEIYSSTYSVVQAFKREGELASETRQYLASVESEGFTHELTQFQRFIEYVHSYHESFHNDEEISNVLSHPINAYHFIKRCVVYWRTYLEHAARREGKDYGLEYQHVFQEDSLWPKQVDLVGVSTGIVRLQEMYKIDLEEFATGSVREFDTDPLTVEDFYDIAMVARDQWKPRQAIAWLSSAAKRLKASEEDMGGPITYHKVKETMAEIYKTYGDYKNALTQIQDLIDQDPDSKSLKERLLYYFHLFNTEQTIELATDSESGHDSDSYPRSCRGETSNMSNEQTSTSGNLYCFMRNTSIPYYQAKAELLSRDPEIILFHDVISDDEQLEIKNLTQNKLRRSSVVSKEDERLDTETEIRVSRTAWVDEENTNNKTDRVLARVGRITGLRTEFMDSSGLRPAEQMQVVNYGVGGMYETHMDYMMQPPKFALNESWPVGPSGDRIATWLFYLEDVYDGGATVFPLLGVRVPVIRGAAVFWWNLFKNGTGDHRTAHAGCPVNIGSKWIANVWIRYIPQIFHRPCSTQELE